MFTISLATILMDPPDPEPPEKLAPDVGFTKIVPPFMEMWTSSSMVTTPEDTISKAPPPAAASPRFPSPPPDPPSKKPRFA